MLSRARRSTRSSVSQWRTLATHAAAAPAKNYPSITPPYEHLLRNLALSRKVLNNRSMTLAEKIVYSHLDNVEEGLAGGDPVRGEKYLKLRPDRVAMQGERASDWNQAPARASAVTAFDSSSSIFILRLQMHPLKWRCCNSQPVTGQRLPCQLQSIATT